MNENEITKKNLLDFCKENSNYDNRLSNIEYKLNDINRNIESLNQHIQDITIKENNFIQNLKEFRTTINIIIILIFIYFCIKLIVTLCKV